jgi:hypothetical protein
MDEDMGWLCVLMLILFGHPVLACLLAYLICICCS